MVNPPGPVKQPDRALQTALAVCLLLGIANDLVFAALRGSYAIYVTDYVFKVLIVGAWFAVGSRLPPPPAWSVRGAGEWLGLVLLALTAGLLTNLIAEWLGRGWRLFSWPLILEPGLRVLDFTWGLMLTAAAEEFAYRRLAFAALPFGPAGNLLASSLLFGLIHWGEGYGAVIATSLAGLALGYAYLRTGSLMLVIALHYIVNLVLFAIPYVR